MKTLQKILILALACMMLLSLTSCKDEEPEVTTIPANTVLYVQNAIAASQPTKVVTSSTYKIGDGADAITLKGAATLLVTRSGSIVDAKYEYRIDVLNPAGTTDINGNPVMIGEIKDVRYSKGDMVASFHGGDAEYSAYDVANKLNAMTLPANGQVTEKADGTVVFTASIANADIQAVLGVAINATGDIAYTVTIKDGKLYQFSASYQTAMGQIDVKAEYSYDKVSFDVVAP